MFLTKKHYIGANNTYRNVTGKIDIKINGVPMNINFNRVSEISEQVGYWRKANQIHNWFVRNVQDGEDDCKEYWVTKEKLQLLLSAVNTVLDSKGTTNESAVTTEWLPPTNGFFFGSQDIDRYYWEDLEYTKNIITEILQSLEDSDEHASVPPGFYYQASW